MSLPIAFSHAAVGLLMAAGAVLAVPKAPIPPPSTDVPLAKQPGRETAVFAGGCFWGVQSVFQRVKGVLATTAGYSGGSAKTATYKQVITETTGHAESVEVVFDPSRITYGQLLRIYFSVAHDPTQHHLFQWSSAQFFSKGRFRVSRVVLWGLQICRS